MLIDINNKQEESIIRLCLKLLISIIFKGQNSSQTFSAQHKFGGSGTVPFESIFKQQGIQEEGEMLKLMQQF
jgi:hypothetical protein